MPPLPIRTSSGNRAGGKIMAAAAVGGAACFANKVWKENEKMYEVVHPGYPRGMRPLTSDEMKRHKQQQAKLPLLQRWDPWTPTYKQDDIMLRFVLQAWK